MEVEAEAEVPMADDDMEMANMLMSEKEQEDMGEMEDKPKNLFGKMKQGLAKKVAKTKE